MAQGQILTSQFHEIAAVPAAITRRRAVVDGDIVSFATDDVASGGRAALTTRQREYNQDVLPAEAWARGTSLFWHETGRIFTALATHWPAGWAAEAKAAAADTGAVVTLDRAVRQRGIVRAPFKYSIMPSLAAVGDYTLREFGKVVLVTSARIIHDGALAPGANTIAIGNGTGANNQILAATAASALDADRENVIALATPVTLDRLVLRVAGAGPFTAGFFVFVAQYEELA